MKKWIYLLIILILNACASNPPSPTFSVQEIGGRDQDRVPLYRAQVPLNWIRNDPKGSLTDTKKEICAFLIQDGDEMIRITIHNFPSERIEERIPPTAQIARWRRQFEQLNPMTTGTTPQAYAGFAGFLFEGTGYMDGEEVSMLGWSMQIAPEHYQNLSHVPNSNQIRADYTIKVVGPRELVTIHRNEIIAFAQSFELIKEIPASS